MSKKSPCALLINDIHASKDNIAEFRKNWNEALQLCKQNEIQYLIVGGDMWLSRSAQTLDVLMAVRWAILEATKQYGLYVIIAEGNHCKVNLENMEGYSHVFSDYENVEVINDFTEIDLSDELSLYVMSYFPESGSFIEKLDSLQQEYNIDSQKKNVLYIHEGIRGGLATPSDDELPANIFKGFDSVLVGHYHNRKQIPGTQIEYIGSSRQHNFGEDEEKGYTILYTDGSTKFVKNEVNQRYRVIEVDVADMDDDFMEMLAKVKADSRYKVKVRVKCNSAQSSSVNKQQLAEAGANKIELVTEQTEVMHTDHQSITQKFDKSGIKEEYTNFCTQKSIDNQLGLHYLDKLK
ncbi:metallophosphoesterase [Prevotella sp. MGM2]|uniref:metallophosphoesterase family protein n=1 Tax=Prevotella sp. MGM2 TaxID=2033406 RepID=UPI000CEA4226|nr:metallophosphoesterase [Prevotella sp. MGM2]